jgi:aminoglycoside phosphotransferase (APT) family kinase protein
MVMERVDGPDMLTLIGRKPWTVERIGRVSGELQAALNNVKAPEELRPLRAYTRERIERIPVPAELEHLRGFALDRLEGLPDGDVICHGDYHPGNIIDGKNGPMIIDWPNVSRGDGDADFARSMLTLRIGDPPPGTSPVVLFLAKFARGLLIWAYRRAYLRRRPVDAAVLAQWTIVRAADRMAEGIEVERAKLLSYLRKAYERRSATG